jgi:chromodomain-helicase-DNA-binding protein 7
MKIYRHDDETNSKHGDADENDEEVRSTKDGEDRPSSSGKNQSEFLAFTKFNDEHKILAGLDDEEAIIHLSSETDPNLIWPTMQDLNTRLRRVITSYQRNYKKEELKQQQKAKVRILFWTYHVVIH